MPKCIIHIGMHKTGSTSIQQSLDGFQNDDFYYANIHDVSNHSVGIYAAFTEKSDRHLWVQSGRMTANEFRAYGDRAREDLEASISQAAGRTLIISGEGIVGLRLKELVSLKYFLSQRQYFGNIFAYVRKPAAFMSSSFQQQIRAQGMADFNIRGIYPYYKRRFGRYLRAFGEDRTRFALFEPKLLKDGDVVADFCSRNGITGWKPMPKPKNTSSSLELTCLIYQYTLRRKKLGLPVLNPLFARRLEGILGPGMSTKLRLSPRIVKPVLEENVEDMVWMARRLGQSLNEDIETELPTDIVTKMDLLAPVQGVRARILRYLTDQGVLEPADGDRNVYELMARAASVVSEKAKARTSVEA